MLTDGPRKTHPMISVIAPHHILIPSSFPWPLVLLISCLVVTAVNIFGLVRSLRHKDQAEIIRRSRRNSFIASMIMLLETLCLSISVMKSDLGKLLQFRDTELLSESLPVVRSHWVMLLSMGVIAAAIGFAVCQILASLARPKE